jgi:hypothetical protein
MRVVKCTVAYERETMPVIFGDRAMNQCSAISSVGVRFETGYHSVRAHCHAVKATHTLQTNPGGYHEMDVYLSPLQ